MLGCFRRTLRPLDERGPLRVMFVLPVMPVGGAETLLINLIRRMDRKRYAPELCCLRSLGALGEVMQHEIPAFANLYQSKYDVRVWGRLTKLLRARRIDAVVTVGTGGDKMFWGRLAAWRAGVPVVMSALHSTGLPDCVEPLNRLLAPWTDAFIGVAHAHGRYLAEAEGCPADKVRVVPNGVDIERFAPRPRSESLRAELRIPPTAPVAGIVAALRPEKNHELFLRVAAKVRKRLPEARFLIVGDGPRRAMLEQLAKDLGIDNVVHFLGTRPDIADLLAQMDVHVLTSHMEANPVSILEAMACGKAIVAPAVGSIPETVVDGVTGRLAAAGDEAEFVNRIVHLLDSPLVATGMGRAGRQRVVDHYSLERMVEGYQQLIEGFYEAKAARQAIRSERWRIGGKFGFWLLRAMSKRPSAATAPKEPVVANNTSHETADDRANAGAARLERFLGRDVWSELVGKRVLDFGCGAGAEAVAAAVRGAEMVYGLDIQEPRLAAARQLAEQAGVADRCRFLNPLTDQNELAELAGTIDVAWSIDSFEHYDRPDAILNQIERLLVPGGRLLVSFGPPWKNPYGCHMWFFNRFPWVHLLFREETILAVRSLYRNDGARRFRDVDGGLNQMTIARFVDLVGRSPMRLEHLRPVPLSTRFVNTGRWWQPLFNNRLLREYTTSVVLCRLRRPVIESTPRRTVVGTASA